MIGGRHCRRSHGGAFCAAVRALRRMSMAVRGIGGYSTTIPQQVCNPETTTEEPS